MTTFTVPSSLDATLLRDFLRKHIGFSLTQWRKLKRAGSITVNGNITPYHTVVQPGDLISLSYEDECSILPQNIPFKVLWEDPYLLIADKPAGMLVHPSGSIRENTLANAVIFHYRQQQQQQGFHPVNRLDRNTSGLLLIAKFPYIQHALSANSLKNIQRHYLAVTEGIIEADKGTIDSPIGRQPGSIVERRVCAEGQRAITHYQVVERLPSATVIELTLETGRTHQIRVHLSSIGHPLIGDDLYGGSTDLLPRQALHSATLTFCHPVTAESMNILSPLPPDITKLIHGLRLSSF